LSFANIPRPQKLPEPTAKVPPVKLLSALDIKLLEELLGIFNRGFVNLYTHHDFNGTFHGEHWNSLTRFCDTWNDVTHEFVDVELESNKKRLYEASLKIADVISKYTSPTVNDFYSVYPSSRPYSEEERVRYRAEAKLINDECPAFVTECEAFIRYARKRLAVI